jgi:hypothetical protein
VGARSAFSWRMCGSQPMSHTHLLLKMTSGLHGLNYLNRPDGFLEHTDNLCKLRAPTAPASRATARAAARGRGPAATARQATIALQAPADHASHARSAAALVPAGRSVQRRAMQIPPNGFPCPDGHCRQTGAKIG